MQIIREQIPAFLDQIVNRPVLTVSFLAGIIVSIIILYQLWRRYTVNGNLGRLHSGKPDARVGAAIFLGNHGSTKAVSPLIQALADADYFVRNAAIKALGVLGDQRASEPLLDILKNIDADSQLIERAANSLLQLDGANQEDVQGNMIDAYIRVAAKKKSGLADKDIAKRHLEKLVKDNDLVRERLLVALSNPTQDIRNFSSKFITLVDSSDIFDSLINLLSSSDTEARESVIVALGNLGDKRAVSYLVPFLSDQHPSIRGATAEATGKLEDRSILEHLIARLKDADLSVRVKAFIALGNLSDRSAIPHILDVFRDLGNLDELSKLLHYHQVEQVFRQVGIDDHELLFYLPLKLKPRRSVSLSDIENIRRLGELKEERAVDALLRLLSSNGYYYQRGPKLNFQGISYNVDDEAARALGEIGHPKAIEPLLARLRQRFSETKLEVLLSFEGEQVERIRYVYGKFLSVLPRLDRRKHSEAFFEAFDITSKGYDFEIVYEEDKSHWEEPTEFADFHSCMDANSSIWCGYPSERGCPLNGRWVDHPERIEIIKTTPLTRK